MTAPLLSPVRWWRDDATRYQTRGPQVVPAAAPTEMQWAFEVLSPLDPAVTQHLERMFDVVGPADLAGAVAASPAMGPLPLARWAACARLGLPPL
jgi:hypothetical protein